MANEYQKGEDAILTLNTYSDASRTALIDVDTVKLTVKKNDGTIVVNNQDAVHSSTGTYTYIYRTTDDGIYSIFWTATLASLVTKTEDFLKVQN